MLANKTCIVTTSLFSCSRYSHESATLANKTLCCLKSTILACRDSSICGFIWVSQNPPVNHPCLWSWKKDNETPKDDIMEAAAPHKFKPFLDSRVNFVYSCILFNWIINSKKF